MNPRKRKNEGVTLIELMFALGIIAIALLGVMSAILHTSGYRQDQRERTLAKEAAADKLEEIRSHAWTDILTTYGAPNNTFNVQGLSDNSNTSGALKGLGTITIDSSNADLYDIRVTITWDGVNENNSYTLRSLYTK